MEPDDTQVAQDGADNRRSPRILRKVLLRIERGGTFTMAHTAVINLHGALILSKVPFDDDTRLDVTNLQVGVRAVFRVVWCGEPDGGYHKLGLELVDECDFWGSAYDPVPGD
jgi:hypothetical protein